MKNFNFSAESVARTFFTEMCAFVPDMDKLKAIFRRLNDAVLVLTILGYSLMMVMASALVVFNVIENHVFALPEPISSMWAELLGFMPQQYHVVVSVIAAALFIIMLKPAVNFLVKASTTALEHGNQAAYEVMLQEAQNMVNALPGIINFLAWKVFLVVGGTALVWFVWHNMG